MTEDLITISKSSSNVGDAEKSFVPSTVRVSLPPSPSSVITSVDSITPSLMVTVSSPSPSCRLTPSPPSVSVMLSTFELPVKATLSSVNVMLLIVEVAPDKSNVASPAASVAVTDPEVAPAIASSCTAVAVPETTTLTEPKLTSCASSSAA